MLHKANDNLGSRKTYLNGVEVQDVVEADDLAGYIIKYQRDKQTNKLILDYVKQEILTEKLYGNVEVLFV
jgi:hypothetical protein